MAIGLGALRLQPSLIDGGPDQESIRQYSPLAVDLDDLENHIPEPDESRGIEIEGGGVVIRIGPPKKDKEDLKFDDNLAESLDTSVLGQIADNLLELIADDDRSRQEWLDTRARGIEILGFKIENMRSSGPDGSAPLEGMSQVRATLLAEAVVRFGANAFAELCPTDGPAKVAEDTAASTSDIDDLADALERLLNHHLTVVDKPWIPDTDAMLARIGVDGCVFRKVYHDPILRRPISRAVYGEDLIVNNSAKSIYDARRITHRVTMGYSTVRRMQLLGAYLDVPLGDPGYIQKSAIDMQSENIAGVRANEGLDRDDRDHEFYECYCELDLPNFEHETDGEPDGLAVPYKVTVHKESRQVVEVRRNWNEEDEMCLPKTYFVQYPFIRGFGFYAIGLSHLLGNITNGITAAYREFLDAGMMACFPALLAARGANRQDSAIIRVGPAGVREIETGGLPIQSVVMGMPYKPPDAGFIAFVEQLEQTGQRLGGTAEVMVGEGRQDAPVGTTLALIEQAIKPLLATHKRLCAAQSDELQLLVERFREDPDALVRTYRGTVTWDSQLALYALNNYTIVTRADPNTASHLQRMLRNAALYQMAKDDPGSFNVTKIRQVCIRGIGFANPDQYLNPAPQAPPPDPKAQAAMMSAQADMLDAQTRAGQLQLDTRNAPMEAQRSMMDAQAKIQTAKMGVQKQQLATHTAAMQARNEQMKPAMEQQGRQFEGQQNQADRAVDLLKQQRDHMHEMRLAGMEQQNAMQQAHMEHQGRLQEAGMQHHAAMQQAGMQHQTDMAKAQFDHASAMAQGGQAHQTAMMQGEQEHRSAMEQGAQANQGKLAQGEQQRQTSLAQGEQANRGKLQQIKATPKPQAAQNRASGGRVNDADFTPARQAPDGEFYRQHRASGRYFRVRNHG
jgi:hypothetical protein